MYVTGSQLDQFELIWRAFLWDDVEYFQHSCVVLVIFVQSVGPSLENNKLLIL